MDGLNNELLCFNGLEYLRPKRSIESVWYRQSSV